MFSIGDRANLIHNTFTQAYIPNNSYEMSGYLVNYLKTWETSNVPWRVFTWHMNKLSSVMEHRSSFVNLRVCGSLTNHLIHNLN